MPRVPPSPRPSCEAFLYSPFHIERMEIDLYLTGGDSLICHHAIETLLNAGLRTHWPRKASDFQLVRPVAGHDVDMDLVWN